MEAAPCRLSYIHPMRFTDVKPHTDPTEERTMSELISTTRAYEAWHERNNRNNAMARVTAHCGAVRVEVQGKGDHPATRRARARRAVRAALGPEWDVREYLGAVLMTHRYSAIRLA